MMRNLMFGAALGGAVAAGMAGTAHADGCAGTITAEAALAAEDARYAAQTGGDFAAMQRLFGDDLLYTHSSAHIDTKASYIEAQRTKAVVYRSMRRSDVAVRIYGCVAVITGSGHFAVSAAGKDGTVDLRFTSVWAARDGGAQFVSWESTSMPKP